MLNDIVLFNKVLIHLGKLFVFMQLFQGFNAIFNKKSWKLSTRRVKNLLFLVWWLNEPSLGKARTSLLRWSAVKEQKYDIWTQDSPEFFKNNDSPCVSDVCKHQEKSCKQMIVFIGSNSKIRIKLKLNEPILRLEENCRIVRYQGSDWQRYLVGRSERVGWISIFFMFLNFLMRVALRIGFSSI